VNFTLQVQPNPPTFKRGFLEAKPRKAKKKR
jgi:hypothetical protein